MFRIIRTCKKSQIKNRFQDITIIIPNEKRINSQKIV